VADPHGLTVAGSAGVLRQLEDHLQPAPPLSGDGTWGRVLAGLRRDGDRGAELGEHAEWTIGVDATVVRAHQHAAGARRASPKDVPAAVLAPTALTGG